MIKTVWGITFYVSDLERAKKFYEETLGLEKKYEYSSYVGFECGGVEVGLTPKLVQVLKVGDKRATYSLGFAIKFSPQLSDSDDAEKKASFTMTPRYMIQIYSPF